MRLPCADQAFTSIFERAIVIWGVHVWIVGVLHRCKNQASIVRGLTMSNNFALTVGLLKFMLLLSNELDPRNE